MNNEYADRQQAIKLRLTGRSVDEICRILGRSPAWFHIWWRRYACPTPAKCTTRPTQRTWVVQASRASAGRAAGPTSLLDLTRVNLQPRRITPELERTIVSIRQRLASQLHPGTRYSLIGANAILAELQTLEILPLPCARTTPAPTAKPVRVERVLQRNGVTLPKVRLAPYLSTPTYPVPHVTESNQLHQVDGVGPIYLKGERQRYYIFVGKDVFDGAVCLRIYRSRKTPHRRSRCGLVCLKTPAKFGFKNSSGCC